MEEYWFYVNFCKVYREFENNYDTKKILNYRHKKKNKNNEKEDSLLTFVDNHTDHIYNKQTHGKRKQIKRLRKLHVSIIVISYILWYSHNDVTNIVSDENGCIVNLKRKNCQVFETAGKFQM